MVLLSYFEGIDSERGICWWLWDSPSAREFVEVYRRVFGHLQGLLAKNKLFSDKFLGIASSTMEANVPLRAIVRRDTGENYPEILKAMARAVGKEAGTKEALATFDRKRTGKRLSNREWVSTIDGDARIAKLKDSRTHLGYQAEHMVDLESGAIVSVSLHHADEGNTKMVGRSPDAALAGFRAFPF